MTDPAGSQPVEFVGGAGDTPRPKVWPYFVLGGVLVALVTAAIVLWGPIKAAGRGVGETVSPYSITITGGWATSDKITGVPNHLILTITNGDIRTVPGLTVQVRSVSGQWFLLSATPHAVMDGNDAFFPDTIQNGKSETINLKLLPPLKAGVDDVHLAFLAGRSGSAIERVVAPAQVRELEPTDVNVTLTTLYDKSIPINTPAIWYIGLENTGLVATKTVKVTFVDLPDTVKIDAQSRPAVSSDNGKTLTFDDALAPGDKDVIGIQVTPSAAGTLQVTALVYIDNARDPVLLASGASPVRFIVKVTPAGG